MEKIFDLLATTYPDVSVSSQLSSKKSDAMHKLELPDDILSGVGDDLSLSVWTSSSFMLHFHRKI